MCALCGVISTRSNRKSTWARRAKIFKRLLIEAQCRGTDATGYGFIDGGNSIVVKSPVCADEFVKSSLGTLNEYKPNIILGHTRAATIGDKNNNYNNHPLVDDSGLILTHNGAVSFMGHRDKEYKTRWEVDTEYIYRIIEKDVKTPIEAIAKATSWLSGSQTVAFIHPSEPNSVWLYRHRNPLVLGYLPEQNIILYASTDYIIESALSKEEVFLKLFARNILQEDVIIQTVSDNHWVCISVTDNDYDITMKKIESVPLYDRTQPSATKTIIMYPSGSRTNTANGGVDAGKLWYFSEETGWEDISNA